MCSKITLIYWPQNHVGPMCPICIRFSKHWSPIHVELMCHKLATLLSKHWHRMHQDQRVRCPKVSIIKQTLTSEPSEPRLFQDHPVIGNSNSKITTNRCNITLRVCTASISTTETLRRQFWPVETIRWRGSFSAAWRTCGTQQPSCGDGTEVSIWVIDKRKKKITLLLIGSTDARSTPNQCVIRSSRYGRYWRVFIYYACEPQRPDCPSITLLLFKPWRLHQCKPWWTCLSFIKSFSFFSSLFPFCCCGKHWHFRYISESHEEPVFPNVIML